MNASGSPNRNYIVEIQLMNAGCEEMAQRMSLIRSRWREDIIYRDVYMLNGIVSPKFICYIYYNHNYYDIESDGNGERSQCWMLH